MGLLTLGTPLEWNTAKKHADHVRKQGIAQFVNIYERLKTRRMDALLWGDEIEYTVCHLDDGKKHAALSLNAHETLDKLQLIEQEAIDNGTELASSWKPEYGVYMLEGTPGVPFGATLAALLTVEQNMVQRRILAQSLLGPGDVITTLTSFPSLGCDGCFFPDAKPHPERLDSAGKSLFIPSNSVNSHARYATLTANIRKRRGSKVSTNLPMYKDVNTPVPFIEALPSSVKNLSLEELQEIHWWSNSHAATTPPLTELPRVLKDLAPDALDDHIYLDSMCFGMGCSCLQITFQACSIEEGRKLYDHLAVMSPIMLALSAAAPIFRGYLTDRDCRWDVISGSVDDRTKEERGVIQLKDDKFRIMKSRYDSISLYLSPGPVVSGGCCGTVKVTNEHGVEEEKVIADYYKEKYNDLNPAFDESIFEELTSQGIDSLLAKHYAHLFIRDPLVIFAELLDQDNAHTSDHFENIQSTNWQTMRFKPPPPSMPTIGWRVEFRAMEVQKTDRENAAFAIFIVLLTRTILSFGLNFYIPLSMVDANMKVAQKRDAVLEEKFWFRDIILHDAAVTQSDTYSLRTIKEIMNGSDSFIGLIPLIKQYLVSTNVAQETHDALLSYVNEISNRASGVTPTNAREMRDFVRAHKQYKSDSVVGDEIVYDICKYYASSS